MSTTIDILTSAIQQLSRSRSLEAVQRVVSQAARELCGADGATFILKDGEFCFYVDENAISPLWKGRRFPLESCISGWVMQHKEPAVVEDVYKDRRIPIDAYRPTFVKSLVVVPIRTDDPLGAIGNYWAVPKTVNGAEVRLLQALADSTAIAIELVQSRLTK